MAYRWFQWTKQVVYDKKNKHPKRKACFRWLPFIFSCLWMNFHTSFFLMNICYHPRSLCILTVLVHSWHFSGRPCWRQLLLKEQRFHETIRIPFVREEYNGGERNFLPHCDTTESPPKCTHMDGILIGGNVVWSHLVSKHHDEMKDVFWRLRKNLMNQEWASPKLWGSIDVRFFSGIPPSLLFWVGYLPYGLFNSFLPVFT